MIKNACKMGLALARREANDYVENRAVRPSSQLEGLSNIIHHPSFKMQSQLVASFRKTAARIQRTPGVKRPKIERAGYPYNLGREYMEIKACYSPLAPPFTNPVPPAISVCFLYSIRCPSGRQTLFSLTEKRLRDASLFRILSGRNRFGCYARAYGLIEDGFFSIQGRPETAKRERRQPLPFCICGFNQQPIEGTEKRRVWAR